MLFAIAAAALFVDAILFLGTGYVVFVLGHSDWWWLFVCLWGAGNMSFALKMAGKKGDF